jgi:hypothetical protein
MGNAGYGSHSGRVGDRLNADNFGAAVRGCWIVKRSQGKNRPIRTHEPSEDEEKGRDDGMFSFIAGLVWLIGILLLVTINPTDSKQPQRRPEQNKRHPLRDPIVWATVGIFLATAASVGVGWLQRETLEKTDKTLRDTLAANKAIERAFVSFDITHRAQDIVENGKVIGTSFQIFIKNSGRTPTKSLYSYGSCAPSDTHRGEPWDLSSQLTTTPSPAFIAPGEEIPFFCRMTSEQMDAISKGAKFGYFTMEALYRDRLNPDVMRLTENAFEIVIYGVTEGTGNNAVNVHLVPRGEHNCADEDCPDYEQAIRGAK